VAALNEIDAMTYRIETYDNDYSAHIVIFGVDTTQPCGPTSKVDLVDFIWTNFEGFSFKKFCMTTVPPRNYPTEANMLYLQHFRAESDGCNIKSQCITCRREFQDDVRDLASCVAPDAPCICNVCRRQPPSLLASAANVLTKFFSISSGLNWLQTCHTLCMCIQPIQAAWAL
jgi:hypothetical protein